MSYAFIKSRAAAKEFTEQLDRERRESAARRHALLEPSREFIRNYLAGELEKKPRTSFDWRPRYAPIKTVVQPYYQPPGETNGKEIIEGEFTVLADVDAQSEGRREIESHAGEGVSGAGSVPAPRWEADQDTPF